MVDFNEQYSDPLDEARALTDRSTAMNVKVIADLAKPEQDGTVTQCACGNDLGERARLGKIRCIACQEVLEKKRSLYV